MSVGKFKVGDRVKIREDLVKNKSYGGHSIPSLNKSTYLGKEGMITRVCSFSYDLNIDDGRWGWTDEMLEPITIPKYVKCINNNKDFDNVLKVGEIYEIEELWTIWRYTYGYILKGDKFKNYTFLLSNFIPVSNPQPKSIKSTIKIRQVGDTTYAKYGKDSGKATRNSNIDKDNSSIGILISVARALNIDKEKVDKIIDVLFDGDKEILESTNIDRDFKIGDKVIGINNWINGNKYFISGIKGVITETEDIFCNYTVKFDSEVEGWGDNNRCLYVKKENIKLLPISKDEEIESLKQEYQELKDKLKDIQNTIKSMYIKVGGKIV